MLRGARFLSLYNVGFSALIKTLLWELKKKKKPFNVCGIMWVIKTMHDGKVIIQSTGMLLNCNTRKYMYFKFYFSL